MGGTDERHALAGWRWRLALAGVRCSCSSAALPARRACTLRAGRRRCCWRSRPAGAGGARSCWLLRRRWRCWASAAPAGAPALRLAEALPAALEGRDLVRHRHRRQPAAGRARTGCAFASRSSSAALAGEPVAVPRLLSLGWYRGFHEDARAVAAAARAARRPALALTVRLRRPHGNLNPHGFDYELQLFEQGVRATGYVRDAPARSALDDAAGHPVERLRQRVRDAHRAAWPTAAPPACWRRWRWATRRRSSARTGSCSATPACAPDVDQRAARHDVRLAGRRCWSARLWRRSAARDAAAAGAAGRALGRPGGGLRLRGVLRLGRAGAAHGVDARHRGAAAQRSGCAGPGRWCCWRAAVVVTLIDPWALLQPGFWLSFVAVGLLMASEPVHGDRRERRRRLRAAGRGSAWRAAVRGGLRTQLVATLGLAPLTLVFFQQVSLVGFVANLVAIPLVTLVITPLALLGALLPPLWTLAAWVRAAAWRVAGLAGRAGRWRCGRAAAPAWAQAGGAAGGALLVLPLPWRLRAAGAAAGAAAAGAAASSARPTGRFELVAVDVGQGTRGAGAHARPPAGLRRRPAVLARQRRRPARAAAAAARARRDAHRPAGAQPPRHRPRRRRRARCSRRCRSPSCSSSLEPGHPLLAQAPRHTRAARPASAGSGTACASRCCTRAARRLHGTALQAEHAVVRAARQRRAAAQRAADRRHRARAGGGAASAACGEALRSDVLLVPHHGSRTSSTRGLPRRRAAARGRVPGRATATASAIRPPDVRGALPRARHRIVVDSPSCGAWRWRRPTQRSRQRGDAAQPALLAPTLLAPSAPPHRPRWRGRCGLEFATPACEETLPMRPSFDEMQATRTTVREHYRGYDRWLAQQPRDVMQSRREEAEMIFRRVGITFAVYGAKDEDGAGTERLIPFDLIPRVIPAHEWARAWKRAWRQRVTALNRFIHDVYHEPGDPQAGIVPGRADLQERAVPPRDDGRGRAGRHLLAHRRHRHRARRQRRRQRQLLRARGQPARAQRRELHAREPQDDDAAVPRAVQPAPRRAGRALPRPAARDAARRGAGRRSTSRPWWCSRRACTTAPTSSTPSWRSRWASSWSRGRTCSSRTTSSTCAPRRARSAST